MISMDFLVASRLAKEIEIVFHGARGHGCTFRRMHRRGRFFETSPGNNAGGPSKIETSLCELGWVYLWPNCVKSAFCLPFCQVRYLTDTSWCRKLISQQTLPDGDRYCWNLVGWFSCCTSGRRQGGTWNSNSSLVKSHDAMWCPADSWEWNRTDVRGVHWAHFWDQRLGDQEPTTVPQDATSTSIQFLSFCTW